MDKDQICKRTVLKSGNLGWIPNSQKLTRIIKAYGTVDTEAGSCCVGYNYIVALLLRFISPDNKYNLSEEMVFWCLYALM